LTAPGGELGVDGDRPEALPDRLPEVLAELVDADSRTTYWV
jgi:hypothetical protein